MFEKKSKFGTMAALLEIFTRKAREISITQKEESVRQRTVANNAIAKAEEAENEAALADAFITNFEALSIPKTAE